MRVENEWIKWGNEDCKREKSKKEMEIIERMEKTKMLDVVYILLSKIQWGLLKVQVSHLYIIQEHRRQIKMIFGFSLCAIPL